MEDKSKQQTTVKVSEADGGVIVTVCHGEEEYKNIIFKDIKKASKAIPGLFSVGQAEAPEEDDKSMKKRRSTLKETY